MAANSSDLETSSFKDDLKSKSIVPVSKLSFELKDFLLSRGFITHHTSEFDINSCEKSTKYTALMIASIYGQDSIVRKLIEHGADVNIADSRDKTMHKDAGRTALMLAANNNKISVIEILLNHGAQINKTDNFDQTALTYAASKNYTDTVEVLLEKGAKCSNAKLPAFGYALLKKNVKMASMLLDHDANIKLKLAGTIFIDFIIFNSILSSNNSPASSSNSTSSLFNINLSHLKPTLDVIEIWANKLLDNLGPDIDKKAKLTSELLSLGQRDDVINILRMKAEKIWERFCQRENITESVTSPKKIKLG